MFKKRIAALAVATLSLLACFVGCSKGDDSDLATPDLVAQQAHVEKDGYKFCGYFKDEALTKRVTKTFDSVPNKYYAKYQPDRAQLFTQKISSFGSNYKLPSMNVEQTIYAEDYMDAIRRYLLYTYNEDRAYASNAVASRYATTLGNDYTEIQIRVGAKEAELNRFYSFHDTTEMQWRYQTHDGIMQTTTKRNMRWNAYLGTAYTNDDGVRFYVVDNKYAVIVGLESETVLESFTLPSELYGFPVTQVSMYIESYGEDAPPLNVKQLTVPSSVENAMIYMVSQNSEQPLEKIVFEEGVQSIQLCSMQTEEVVIPSTAYYVDLRKPAFGRNAPTKYLLATDQKVTVNGGEHYYTEDGMLYSTEGDLVHQFANRHNLNVTVNSKARRVLRRSITGFAKNITIPANVEYCDVFYNEYTRRYNLSVQNSYNSITQPVIFLHSQAVAQQWLQEYAKTDYLFTLSALRYAAPYILLDENIQVDYSVIPGGLAALELNPKHVAVEGNTIYRIIETDLMTGEQKWIHEVYSYLTEDYPKDDLSFDPVLQWYYDITNPPAEQK